MECCRLQKNRCLQKLRDSTHECVGRKLRHRIRLELIDGVISTAVVGDKIRLEREQRQQ